MGACFITEGAIPFAAADPLRVLPACIIGSAVAGGLSMFFGCGLRAPHGGHFRSARHQSSLRLSGSGYSGGVGRDAPAWRFEKKN